MTDIGYFANAVLEMRSLQIKYSELMHRMKVRKLDGEELAEAYSEMRKSEQAVHQMCLDVLGIEEDE